MGQFVSCWRYLKREQSFDHPSSPFPHSGPTVVSTSCRARAQGVLLVFHGYLVSELDQEVLCTGYPCQPDVNPSFPKAVALGGSPMLAGGRMYMYCTMLALINVNRIHPSGACSFAHGKQVAVVFIDAEPGRIILSTIKLRNISSSLASFPTRGSQSGGCRSQLPLGRFCLRSPFAQSFQTYYVSPIRARAKEYSSGTC